MGNVGSGRDADYAGYLESRLFEMPGGAPRYAGEPVAPVVG